MSNLDLKAIDPRRSSKYSPNLFKYLRRDRDWNLKVFSSQGNLYLGYIYDGEFNGTHLHTVLSYGLKAERFCYFGRTDFEEVPDFWEKYIAIGRCAIDPEHAICFADVGPMRFVEDGDMRTCQWCGVVQHLRRWQEVVDREAWEMATPAPVGT